MKLAGPLYTFAIGLILAFAGGRLDARVTHNIGRGIADSVIGAGLLWGGSAIAVIGLIWFVLRLAGRRNAE